MKLENEFKKKLNVLVNSIAIEGRSQVEEIITSVVNAGGTSERALVEMLNNQDLNLLVRLNICWMIPRLGIAEAENILITLMADPSAQIREEAAIGLGLISKSNAVPILLQHLEQDNSKVVRLATLHALGIVSSPQSVDGIIRVLKSPGEDNDIRADAAEALAHIKDECILSVLIESLKDNSPLVRYSAAYSLGQQGNARALTPLREIVNNDHSTTPWGSVASCALNAIKTITSR